MLHEKMQKRLHFVEFSYAKSTCNKAIFFFFFCKFLAVFILKKHIYNNFKNELI